ncbi:2-C-methyl-D-erythritol 4-phosphate cytidylyltransferase [Ancylomarina euxinus]|uniref:2-C-methyl-D-erythritol 4-phosphate cytidylyltransferase n=1 Tax=Ancylomarina euxinus TaxID=2283627 RepID=A0A425XX73_9BACT|nr:IspD/TarI family cytidylyltransferase [Ancylomarina euxinus]MCZ4696137.1 IspD/TarI family cytidylyltransferase [Ancylomarina euxinus]MUP16546.1 NTP transferase domain-containing protein [Ancylomarina euxinus]RRG19253.1 2-C-methyl-D-erythritol 4-phosphate cytidylyltransferase [Ancylomarina euxinus]
MKNVAVILAGGTGKRMGAYLPKQFLKIAGKSIIEHSIAIFEKHTGISEICVVIHSNFVADVERIVKEAGFSKVRKILCGGKERSDSSLAAISAYEKELNVNLIFHDAVRPFVNQGIIDDVVSCLAEGKSVAVAIPSTDTIFRLNDVKCIESVPPRDYLYRAQTPQAFSCETIKKAYHLALKDPNFKASDDCGVVLKYLPKEPIHIVEGDEKNIKITFEQDLAKGENLIDL